MDAPAATVAGMTREEVQAFVDRWFALDDEAASTMGEAMNQCKGIRNDQKDVLNEFSNKGGNRKSLRATIKRIALERKRDGIRDELPPPDQDAMDEIEQKLGLLADTPLGQAAMKSDQRMSGAAAGRA